MSVLLALAAVVAGAVAPAAADDPTATLQVIKSTPGVTGPLKPGDTFDYRIQVGCSSTNTQGCTAAELTDTLPDPIILDPGFTDPVAATVSGGGTATVTATRPQRLTVTPRQSVNGGVGLAAGSTMTVIVHAKVPTDASGDFDGSTITNTATATATNADDATGTADVTIAVPTDITAALTKSASPTSVIPAVAGKPVTWTLTPSNTSNRSVDTLVLQDAAAQTDSPWQGYLDFAGISTLTMPSGATAVQIQWRDDAGDWHTSYGPGALPTDPNSGLPSDLSTVKGIRITYTGTIGQRAGATVKLASTTNATVSDIPVDQSVTVNNTASAQTSQGTTTSPLVTADAHVTISSTPPAVTLTKSFADSTLVSGQSTTATVRATVGSQDVHELTVHEPTAGQPNFSDQGLRFDGFGDVQWPHDATSATITYDYADCATDSSTTTTEDTLPAPNTGCTVDGYTVTFTAATGTDGIDSAAYAVLPMDVTALKVTDLAGSSSTNHVDALVKDIEGQQGTATAQAGFTVSPLHVDTEAGKQIIPDDVWSVPGAQTTVSLSGKVSDSSTIGSQYLDVTDPAEQPSQFWDHFDAVTVRTDVPAHLSLTVRYYDRDSSSWVDLPGCATDGAQSAYVCDIPASLRDDIGGISFHFAAKTAGALIPPGTTVLPAIDAELASPTPSTEQTYTNTVRTTVHNPDAIVPTQTDDASATVTVHPVSGAGPDLVDKDWLQTSVPALSNQTRTARIAWSTEGLPFTTMTITDPASAGELTNVASSVYDAFDLAAIKPITGALDPHIGQDKVTKVELYSAAQGSWQDITTQACANGCTGTFGGYSLTAAQRADTLGVRLTFASRTDGGRVGSSYGHDRHIDLDFTVRDKRRSDTDAWVLGDHHDYTYNTTQPGLVDNTVAAAGVGPDYSQTSTDHDPILIEDAPVNVTTTKTFDQSALGLPAAGTAQSDYPLITATLTGTNQSAARVSSLTLSDPADSQADPSAYDVLNLYSIDDIVVPASLSTDDVTVQLRTTPGWTSYSLWAVSALTPDQLQDVTGVRIVYASDDGTLQVASGATAGADLTYQLRAQKRSDGSAVTATPEVLNVANTQAESPGRIPCPGTSCSTGSADAQDDFAIADAKYSVLAGKNISPDNVAENGSRAYTTQLTARPAGNARSTLISLTDTAATFWNTMAYTSSSVTLPKPVNQARMDVLAGTDLTYDAATNTLGQTCHGSTDLTDCWTTGSWVASTAGSTVDLAPPSSVAAADVRGVRYEFRHVVNGSVVQWERPFNPTLQVQLRTTRLTNLRLDRAGNTDTTPVPTTRPGLQAGPGETSAGTISDTVAAHGDGQFGPQQTFEADDTATDTTVLTHLPNKIKVEKYPGSTVKPPTFSSDGSIPFVMRVTNTGSWPMTGLKLADQVGTDAQGSQLVESSGANSFTVTLATDGVTMSVDWPVSLDPSTGKLVIAVPADFVFAPGAVITVSAALQFRDGLSPSTVVANSISATSDRDFEQCAFTHDGAAATATTNVSTCAADTHVQPLAQASLDLKKYVKGDGAGAPGTSDDDLGVLATGSASASDCGSGAADSQGFYTYPCVPITRPGGQETWRLDVTNVGNTPARVVAAVDRLPEPGDSGPFTGQARGSQWRTLFRAAVRTNLTSLSDDSATFATYYSTQVGSTACYSNAVAVETADATENTGCGFGWTKLTGTESDATLDAIKSVKFVLRYKDASDGLEPDEKLQIRFNTATPTQLPGASAVADGLPVAYNSYVASSRTAAVVNQPEEGQLLLEPSKVGVATATGRLQLSKDVVAPDGFTGALPAGYRMKLTCTSAGDDVSLQGSDGSDASVVTVPADGTTTVNSADRPVGLPLFANCTVAEVGAPAGAVIGYDPSSRQVTALRSLDDNPRVNHPYTVDDDSSTKLTVTNTFSNGGFTVSKAVDDGGAVDQAGDPIDYDETYGFTATCPWEGSETLPAADRSFTLKAGDTKAFTGVPTGAVCTVTETQAGTSSSTDVKVSGDDGATTTDDSATFTVGTGDATAVMAAFTNRYATGSLAITKRISGAGADRWGAATFTLKLVCTRDGVTGDTVYDATHELTADQTWRIDDLPAGANCVVTETQTGGANSVTLPDPVTIEPSSQTEVNVATVTNHFDAGALTVTKSVSGAAATDSSVTSGSYTMTLACTREVNGATVDVAIPGGATHTIGAGASYTWTGLPTGASCTVAETASDPTPQDVTISPDGPYTIGASTDDPVQVSVDNRFDAGYVRVVKEVKGPGAGSFSTSSFAMQLVCTFGGDAHTVLDRTFTLTWDGRSATVDSDVYGPVPVGSSCTVTETDDGNADSTPAPVTVVVPSGTTADAPVDLGITNRYSAGRVSVTKRVNGAAANTSAVKDLLFTLRTTCQLQVGSDRVTVFSVDAVLQAGETIDLVDNDGAPVLMPIGTRCWLTETKSGGANKVTIAHSSWATALVVTAGSSDDAQVLALSATNTFSTPPVSPPSDNITPPGGGNSGGKNGGGSSNSGAGDNGGANSDIGAVLPDTGGPARGLIALGVLLVSAGVGTVWFTRRRRAG